MYNVAANYGFLIRDSSEEGSGFEQQFHSREKGESMPELVITFGLPLPTPTATLVPPTATLPPPSPTATSIASSCTTTTVTLSADADAWIDQASSSSNKGSDSILKVQAKSGNNFRALVRFAVPALQPGCVVQSATLRMYAPSSTSGCTLRALRISGSWTENGVTWGNQPATASDRYITGAGHVHWLEQRLPNP